MVDLFKTKEQQLLDWMKQKGFFASHEVVKWGLDNYYLRADRTKRDLMERGIIKKLSPQEKAFRGFKCKDSVYQISDGKEVNA